MKFAEPLKSLDSKHFKISEHALAQGKEEDMNSESTMSGSFCEIQEVSEFHDDLFESSSPIVGLQVVTDVMENADDSHDDVEKKS